MGITNLALFVHLKYILFLGSLPLLLSWTCRLFPFPFSSLLQVLTHLSWSQWRLPCIILFKIAPFLLAGFLYATYHLITCCIIYLFLFLICLKYLQYKFYGGKDFCLFYSLLYPQSLTPRKHSVNSCWMVYLWFQSSLH